MEHHHRDISGTKVRAIGISGTAYAIVESNLIRDAGAQGVRIGRNSGAMGYEPLSRNNTIEATDAGIMSGAGGAPVFEGNTLSGNSTAIYAVQASGTYAENVLEGNGRALVLSNESPSVGGNTIQGNEVG